MSSTSVWQQGLKPQSVKEELLYMSALHNRHEQCEFEKHNAQAISALAFEDVFVFRHVGIMMRTYVCYER